MIRVMLLCSAGMSTSLLVEKIKKAAAERAVELDITARSEAEAKNYIDQCQVILLGPQVRFLLASIQKLAEGKQVRVDTIANVSYGRMDGNAVLDQILELADQLA